jgi:branched-chain amino acid transport system permease protein
VLGAYALALVPVTIMAAGAVVLIEMSYRLATQPELGTKMRLLLTAIDAASPWPWIVAAAMLIAGFAALRMTWASVAAAWNRANAEASAR